YSPARVASIAAFKANTLVWVAKLLMRFTTLEIWTGINFGIAAFLVKMGMKDEGLKLAEVVVHQIYNNGLQFRTPEAITTSGTFRACTYLRAMAIWLIYFVITK
uniref:GH116 family glycosyl hydrolase n=1 Tax=Aetokthonos hydrillicola TaxID=1550245 RepID=UPI001B1CB0CB